ncbi:MAG: hypothetical protein Q4D29_04890 [Lachnospiraceae bacterium]|nr:hypothetical protein [Lachnospiraceae bacterium]
MVVDSLRSVGALYSNKQTTGSQNRYGNPVNSSYAEAQESKAQTVNNIKSLLRGDKNQRKPASIADSSISYAQKLREQRTNTKSTANELKQLKYNSKNISSQIRSAKKSINAKQVASKARREVIQLKLKMSSGKYDKEELQAAIEHAKSMERAANKKARHLEEEELIKITDKPAGAGLTAAELEEKLENESEEAINKFEEEMAAKEEELEQFSEEQIAEMEQAIAENMEEVQQMIQESMEESMEDMSEDIYDLLAEAMEDMMEETLEGLMDGMMVITDYEMTEEEFKSFKLKHRTSEDKSLVEADTKYLKALFDIYDKRMSGGGGSGADISGASSASVSVDTGNNIPNVVDISI